MSGTIRLAAPGAQTEELLASAIGRAQAADRLAPVTVVGRSSAVNLDLRRRLAGRGPVAGLRFTLLPRLVEQLGAPSLAASAVAGLPGVGPRAPLGRPMLGAAVRVALRERPGVLAPVVEHPSTEASVTRAYELLRPLSGADRKRLAQMSRRARDVVELTDRARTLLAERTYDLQDLSAAAGAALRAGNAETEEVGCVVLYLPEPSAVAAHLDMLGALAAWTTVDVVLAETGDPVADRAVGGAVGWLVGAGFDGGEGAGSAGPRARFGRVIGAPDAEEEVRLAIRLLMGHMEAGGSLGRCLVAYPTTSNVASAYASLVREQLDLAGVRWSRPSGLRLAEKPEARLVSAFVELATGEGPRFERAAVIGLLDSGVTPRSSLAAGLDSLRRRGGLPIGLFDRCSRLAGVVSEPAEWERRLSALARRESERSPTSSLAVAAGDLATLVRRLIELGSSLEEASSWEEAAAGLAQVADQLVEPGDIRTAIAEAVGSLGELGVLERLAPAGSTERGEQLRSAVASVLDRRAGPEGRFGVGPTVGTVAELGGMQSDLLVVLGLCEGVVPGRTPEDPLVTETERQAVGVLAEAERMEERDRRTLLCLLGASAKSVALFPRVDRSASRTAYPSRWLLGDLFQGGIEETPSYSGALAAVARGDLAPAGSADLEMAAVQSGLAHRVPPDRLFVADLGDLRRRYAAERERELPLSRFAGAIGAIGGDDAVFGEVLSATSMERLSVCPLQFFFDRLLRLSILEAPERVLAIEARDKGSLIHSVLEEFVRETAIDRESADFAGWGRSDLRRLEEIGERVCDEYERRGLTGKAVFWQTERRQVLRDLVRYMEVDEAWRLQDGAVPVVVEMGFGMDETPPVAVQAGGREIRFRGKIDRIDRAKDGSLRVIDYKSGRAESYGSIDGNPLGGGRHLQLPIYAKAAEERWPGGAAIRAEYRFCSSVGGFSRVGVNLDSALERDLGGVLGVLAGVVAAGNLPPRPGKNDNENCRHCDFEAVCRLDRGDAWRRSAAEGAMRQYVALVEGSGRQGEAE